MENHVEKSNEPIESLSSTRRESSGYDSFAASERIASMWLRLAETIEGHISDVFISGGSPQESLKLAMCAEACYWQASGEATPHDVKDVI